LVVQVLLTLENEGWNKHVESAWFPCADEGSTPSSSTYVTPSRGLTLVRVLLVASLCKSGRAERDSLQLHLRYALARSYLVRVLSYSFQLLKVLQTSMM